MILPKTIFGIPITDIVAKLYRSSFQPRYPVGWKDHHLYRARRYAKVWLQAARQTQPCHEWRLICHHIAYNRLTVKQGIEKVNSRTLRFVDGTIAEFDVMIAATGYRISFPFLSSDIVEVKNNGVALYKKIVPPSWPGLYLIIGLINTNTALPNIFEERAHSIREFALGHAAQQGGNGRGYPGA